jgi:hypothetical protein
MEIQVWAWGVGGSAFNSAIPAAGIVLLHVRDGSWSWDYRIDGAGQQLEIPLQAVFMTHYLPVKDVYKESLTSLQGKKVAIKSSRKVMLGTGSTEVSVIVHPYNETPVEVLSSHIDDAMGILMPAFDVLGTAQRYSDQKGKQSAIAKLSGPASPTIG